MRTSGLTDIALTKLDVLAGLEEIKVCVAYKINGRIVTEMPASLTAMRNVIPVYDTLRGWTEFTTSIKERVRTGGYTQLPEEIKNYINFIEKNTNCPVKFISFGADRNETLIR